ncbi:MAG: cysteine desulfurase-like protein [Herpetosiphon sp.]
MTEHTFNVHAARKHFPALHMPIDGTPQIFLDNPGGTQVPRMVADAMSTYLLTANANVHGAFATSRRTDQLLEAAHVAMADLLNAADPTEIVFGQNMTSLTFAWSRSFARDLQPGDEIVVTRLDHDANVAPWLALEEKGVVIRWADFDPEDCTLDYQHLAGLIGERTRLVAVGLASNAVGTINDVRRIAQQAHAVGALMFVDAVQGVPHLPVDVQALDCDLLLCSAYKFFGPHQGILWARRSLLEQFRPYKVRPASDELPGRWETGTQSHEGQAGTLAAVQYLEILGQANEQHYTDELTALTGRRRTLRSAMLAIRDYEQHLSRHMLGRLKAMPHLHLYGIPDINRVDQRVPTFAVVQSDKSPQSLATHLAENNIASWAGNYYALALVERLGRAEHGMLRIGLAHYNTTAEIDRCLDLLRP